MALWEVTVEGGVVTLANAPEHGMVDLTIKGTVIVEAKDERDSRKRVYDVIQGDGGGVLTLADGEAVEFEVIGCKRVDVDAL